MSDKIPVIYAIIASDELQLRYIGFTDRDLFQRLNEHVYDSKNGRGSAAKREWILAVLRRGAELIIFELEETTYQKWEEDEAKWIKIFQTAKAPLLNESEGGLGNSGVHPSEETRQKISTSMKINRYGKKID